eukprot:NODE_225_length_2096_cov_774.207621_g193_i0.p1 GENE.NODE_225_length_2096_cov_774.207621_g193_i0~~NODE_225_length_2096_cov_774.207621_g193_i0.p1  ORF type:complete len:643 (+),score=202.46 NODE_225_length_2096_cov_774.207621_g193_i0:274-1929(+)
MIVDTVRFDLSPHSTFKKDGKPITYAAYMKEKHNINDPTLTARQPLLENVSRTQHDREGNLKVTHILPSLCFMTGPLESLQPPGAGMDIIRHTAVRPEVRMSTIFNNVTGMITNTDFQNELTKGGMSIDGRMLRLPARVLPTPALRHGSGNLRPKDTQQWDVRWPMFRSANIKSWVVVTATPDRVRGFLEMLRNVSRETSIGLSEPKVLATANARPDSYMATIQSAEMRNLRPEFVMIIVQTKDEPYKRVKHFLTTTVGVPSQVVQMRTVEPPNMSKANKVLMQMNCKVRGAPWAINLGIQVPTMFVGISLHHGSDLEHMSGSTAGFVASLDANVTHFYSRAFPVRARQQIMLPRQTGDTGLGQIFGEAVDSFGQSNGGTLPRQVVVYREGGSEGDLESFLHHEVPQFSKALEAAAPNCALTFIVVLKQDCTRFFACAPGNPPLIGNPTPGTIVDTNIVSNYISEFILCCQHVNQGSATPTKYQKIYDTSNLTTNDIQKYTYGLSHMYFNWNGTVRTPCVVKCASKLAQFQGMYLKNEMPVSRLRNSLFYL